MKPDDLTKVKYVGASRMKSLKNLGITTIKQLYETPMEKLAQVSTIGPYYAKLIKAAVKKIYQEKPGKPARKPPTREGKKPSDIKENLKEQIKVLKKRLKSAGEDLGPEKKRKFIELYMDFKKRSKTLIKDFDSLNKVQGELAGNLPKNIIKKANALNDILKNAGKKIKKKKQKKISQEIKSLSKIFSKSGS